MSGLNLAREFLALVLFYATLYTGAVFGHAFGL
jgi:hypothetical protein